MPDYNRKAAAYWWTMVLAGSAALVYTVQTLLAMPRSDLQQVAAGAAIAMVAGFFPVRIPRSKNSFAAGEIFIFLLLLMHGPEAAVVAAAGEGFIGAYRTSRRWTSRIATPAMACVSMFTTGSLFEAATAAAQASGHHSAALLLAGTMATAVLYFCVNTSLSAAVPYLKRNEWPSAREMFGNFGWVGITFAGSASVACLLYLTFREAGVGVLLVAAPIIALLLATLHYFFRQLEADDKVRKSQLASVEREAELASRHIRELEVSERRFHSAFTHASIGMGLVSSDGHVLQINDALSNLLGLDREAIEHCPFGDFVEAQSATQLDDRLRRLNDKLIPSFTVDLRMKHRDPTREVWAAVHGTFFSEVDAVASSLILQVQDITSRRQAESKLHRMAFHDSLTGLPNRRRFQDELARALDQSSSDPERRFCVLFMDFDRFKLINDSLGHAAGDEFLVTVARRIEQYVRPRDIVARLGGDEFAILAESLDSDRYAVTLADRLLEILRMPVTIQGTEITSSVSIGITFSSIGYATPADMLRDADTAMYKAKTSGKARYALFDAALHVEVSNRLRLEGDLRHALATGGLWVAYQPLLELTSGRVTGFEALVRWDHPEFGAISPMTFIPIAEEAGMIVQLTDFVMRRACLQLRSWQQAHPRFEDLQMHVNVSGSDVAHPGFVARVMAALVETRVEAQYLTLELTENILMERLEAALPTLAELRRLGVGLSVDDFGTGYSSLRHLSNLPVNSLKIDRAFVNDMQEESGATAVVRAIVLLGRSLGKAIVAEGIETAEQLDRLRELGCSTGQGFHLGRPVPADQIDVLLFEALSLPLEQRSAERRPPHLELVQTNIMAA